MDVVLENGQYKLYFSKEVIVRCAKDISLDTDEQKGVCSLRHSLLLAVGDERSEPVAVERSPLVTAAGALQSREQGHRAFVNEIHSPGINGDVCCAELSDGCSRGVQADEMHIDIAVVLEGS